MHTDLRHWALGALVGGDLGRVETCPRCKLPGAQQRSKRNVFVHSFEVALSGFTPLDTCRLARQVVDVLESARKHAKPSST